MTMFGAQRPVISRETRLLLATILISVAALWVLARLRFQERDVTSDPVPPVLAQLRPQSSFEDLAGSVAELRPRAAVSIVAVRDRAAHRIRRDAAVMLSVDGDFAAGGTPAVDVRRRDEATGITIVTVADADLPQASVWSPRTIDYPRYLVAVDVDSDGISLRPVFVARLSSLTTPMWPDSLWALPPQTALAPGTFVLASEGSLAGLVVEEAGRRAIVPGSVVLQVADRLLQERDAPDGQIGVSVQPMSPAIRSATGARTGVVVTWVERDGPAAALAAMDVIEAIDGQEILTPSHWRARIARLKAGETIQLRVRAGDEVRDVAIVAAPVATAPVAGETAPDSLGLTLRTRRGIGVEVIDVDPRSAAARAGLEPGDLITAIGPQTSPTSSQVSTAYNMVSSGATVLVAITRGDGHHVVALDKP